MSNVIEDLKLQIKAMPAKIQEAGERVNKAKSTLRQVQAEYELSLSMSYLTADGNIKDREMKAATANKELHQKVMNAQEALDMAQTALKYGEDTFVALRKEASMIEAEMKNLNN